MDHTTTTAALASCLPGGLKLDMGDDLYWHAADIARFQTARLAEAGYRLVYVEDDATATIAGALMKLSREGKIPAEHGEILAAALAEAATEAGEQS